jgi:hypothetical protein
VPPPAAAEPAADGDAGRTSAGRGDHPAGAHPVALIRRLPGNRPIDRGGPAWTRPGRRVAAATAERLANRRDQLEVAPRLAGVLVPGPRKVDVDHVRDPTWPGAHDHDPRREEDRLGDGVGDEQDRRARLLPDPEDLAVHPLAGHLVERAERLVHQEDRWRERQGAGDRHALLHPAGELERAVLQEVAELDEVEHLLRPRGSPVGVPAEDLEGQLHVVLDGPPVEEDW